MPAMPHMNQLASPSLLALQAVPALGLQRNLGAVLRDKREGVGAATAWPITDSLGWLRTFS